MFAIKWVGANPLILLILGVLFLPPELYIWQLLDEHKKKYALPLDFLDQGKIVIQ